MLFVYNWKDVLKKSATVWVAIAGAILPAVPDLLLKWVTDDSSAELLSPDTRNWIRALLMFFIIPFVRITHQKALHEPGEPAPVTTAEAIKELKGDTPNV